MTTKKMSMALGLVDEMGALSQRGDVALLAERRRTLDDLCAGWRGGALCYPKAVAKALAEAGLRNTP